MSNVGDVLVQHTPKYFSGTGVPCRITGCDVRHIYRQPNCVWREAFSELASL